MQWLTTIVGVVAYVCLIWIALSFHHIAQQLTRIADKFEKQ